MRTEALEMNNTQLNIIYLRKCNTSRLIEISNFIQLKIDRIVVESRGK